MKNEVILYGFEGTNERRRCVRYYKVPEERTTLLGIKNAALFMKKKFFGIKEVYACKFSEGLHQDYLDARRHNRMDEHLDFHMMIEQLGVKVA